jgi:dihydrofolate reductase
MSLAIIVAVSENEVIGNGNRLPWHIPEDLAMFRQTTAQHAVIVGRSTHESIVERLGGPLPGRYTVLVSRTAGSAHDGVSVACTFEDAARLADEYRTEKNQAEAYVIGGASLYVQALPVVRHVYLTRVHRAVSGDRYLPAGWLGGFSLERSGGTLISRSGIAYTFQRYVRA